MSPPSLEKSRRKKKKKHVHEELSCEWGEVPGVSLTVRIPSHFHGEWLLEVWWEAWRLGMSNQVEVDHGLPGRGRKRLSW